MKLSRLYSNKPEIFCPVDFRPGLNVVLAEIRRPENKKKDTHNLGKTTLVRLLDFCFLGGYDQGLFLFKHINIFKDFVFFLEIELTDHTYLTVRRSVGEHSKIAFLKHTKQHQNFSALAPDQWDHFNVPFSRARDLLDSLLDWRALKPWSYRKLLGYLLRAQDDYRDVFHLRKFAGAHSDWKPFLAHILGFDADLIAQHYGKEQELAETEAKIQTINHELGGSIADASKIDGLLLLKQQELEKKQRLLEAFDFRVQDKAQTKELVDTLDEEIARLNARRYSLNQNRKKIVGSMAEGKVLFSPDDAQKLFEEAGVLFEGQIKKDFQQLIAFNKSITEERRSYLEEELGEVDEELKKVGAELNTLGRRRSEILKSLTSTDSFTKYKQASSELVTLRADITSLELQRQHLHRLQELRTAVRTLTEERVALQTEIEANVDARNADSSSLFSAIRLFFNEIIEEVIDRKALLSVSPNVLGHLEFKAEILDEAGNATSAHLGHTYKKLLCIAFDMAILRGHLGEKFPRFVYHDGVFETLDDRKKENLLNVIRRYNELDIQSIITLIDSDMPAEPSIPSLISLRESMPQNLDDNISVFGDEEIVLLLHDEGESGRLFKMKSW